MPNLSHLTTEQRERAEVLLAYSAFHDSPEEQLKRELADQGEDYASIGGRRKA